MLLPAAGQELPPGVLLLSRIKAHVRQQIVALPDYTCLETTARYHKAAGAKTGLKQLDTVRLEVLFTGQREMYASPGDRSFRNSHPGEFTSSGLSADGLFVTHLQSLFVNEQAVIQYRGEVDLAGRPAARYDFRVPLMMSGWNVQLAGGGGIVGMKGSFWADLESLDVLRLEIHADEIPLTVPAAEITAIIDYARAGSGEVVLPQSARLYLQDVLGAESENRVEFTHCRAFHAQSAVRFEPASGGGPAPPEAARVVVREETLATIPAGLKVTIALTTPLDAQTAVGALLSGKVSGNVPYQGNILIPDGAPVEGRVRRLERHSDSGDYFVVGLEFSEIRVGDTLLSFYADLEGVEGAEAVEWSLWSSSSSVQRLGWQDRRYVTTRERINLTGLPGVGSFFVRGSRLNLPPGFRMAWKTRAPER